MDSESRIARLEQTLEELRERFAALEAHLTPPSLPGSQLGPRPNAIADFVKYEESAKETPIEIEETPRVPPVVFDLEPKVVPVTPRFQPPNYEAMAKINEEIESSVRQTSTMTIWSTNSGSTGFCAAERWLFWRRFCSSPR